MDDGCTAGGFTNVPVQVKPRRPFEKEEFIDYDEESGDEEEEPSDGEDLFGASDSDSDDEGEVDLEDFVVPTGHLSDDEGEDVDASDSIVRKQVVEKQKETEQQLRKVPVVVGPLFEVTVGDDYYDQLAAFKVDFLPVIDEKDKEEEEAEKQLFVDGLRHLAHVRCTGLYCWWHSHYFRSSTAMCLVLRSFPRCKKSFLR